MRDSYGRTHRPPASSAPPLANKDDRLHFRDVVALGKFVDLLGGDLGIAREVVAAVLNALRTARFAQEELRCTKTEAIDALRIARFAQQKRPRAAQLPDAVTEELRELGRLL